MSSSQGGAGGDAALVAALRRGDDVAGQEFRRRYERLLWWFAYRFCRYDAEECMATLVLHVLVHLDQWSDCRGGLDQFVATIARNKALDLARARGRAAFEPVPDGRDFVAPNSDPDLRLDIEYCKSILSEQCKQLLSLAEQGASRTEIAVELGWPIGKVYVELHRCRSRLRKCLNTKAQMQTGGDR